MVEKIDWGKYKELRPFIFTEEEFWEDPIPEVQPKWKISPKVCIQCAVSGGGARLHNANLSQPRNLDDIRDAAAGAIEAGASVIHFDNELRACYTKDGKEIPPGESYAYVVKPLIEKYGREKLVPHINCLRGTYQQQMLPIVTGLAELTYLHPIANPRWLNMTIPILKEHNVKAEIVNHENSELDLAERLFIRSGIMPNPNLWILLPGCPARAGFKFLTEYLPHERAMCRRLIATIDDIRELDPGAFIVVCCAGRASKYLITLALILGIHIRVGMEDTVWKLPHSDEKITSNAEEVREAIELARMLGREVMTPNEYRQAIGLKPRFDHLPK
jgi:3-keto-5-aminohexanoate cleavage enzyme